MPQLSTISPGTSSIFVECLKVNWVMPFQLLRRTSTRQNQNISIDNVRAIFNAMREWRLLIWCDTIQAALVLSEGNFAEARLGFQKSLTSARGKEADIMSYCLRRLADVRSWESHEANSSWTVVFLDNATRLFSAALEGFTLMDVHCSRGKCMLGLGDLAEKRGDLSEAAMLWTEARPLFERSSRARDVLRIDQRLTALETASRNVLSHLKNLKAPTKVPTNPTIKGEIKGQIMEREVIDDGGRGLIVVV
ncbi:hypothetical protein DFH09DRAFT_1072383 [Mycena vulgaris]|nr:hypothetical protein DFH09DRAFT_1072383 [Mycena vulgaris]